MGELFRFQRPPDKEVQYKFLIYPLSVMVGAFNDRDALEKVKTRFTQFPIGSWTKTGEREFTWHQ